MAFMLEEKNSVISSFGVHIGFIAVISDRVCPFLLCVAKTPFNTSFDRYKVSFLVSILFVLVTVMIYFAS